MTLKDFVKLHKTQEEAARALGFPLRTVHRWIKGETRPSRLAIDALKAKGIES